MDDALKAMLSIVTAIIGVAIVAVIVSQKSNTAGVLKSAAGGFSEILNSALSPIL